MTLAIPFTLIAVSSVGGMLTAFLFAILAIALIGGIIWGINTYIHPIPAPILSIIAIVMVILVVLWMLGDMPSPFGRP